MSGLAIVGMAGRFPGARSVDELWRGLLDGRDCITRFAPEELLAAGVPAATVRAPDYVPARGVLHEPEWFDAEFFGLTHAEASTMDPQHRVLLECAWEAMEHAGHDPGRVPGRLGVFAGAGAGTYLWRLLPALDERDAWFALIGNEKDFLATRVAHALDATGPGITVQTACSTSLVAVAMACESLLGGVCDLALAGGVTIQVPQVRGYHHVEGGILSPDGRCRPFDAAAAGTVPGNGAALVVLRRLDDALADGDTVHAVVRGFAVNNDGAAKVGFTAPGLAGQAAVIEEALAMAGVGPEDIGYVEAHGTATALGDPLEFEALSRAFARRNGRRGWCGLGSVKGNVGHLDAAAGVAGLVKAALMVREGRLAPSLHFERPNPAIDLDASPFRVVTEAGPWDGGGRPRRAGVSSFGIGGTNAHVVVEQPPAPPPPAAPARAVQVLTLSARTASALEAQAGRLAEHLADRPDACLADVATTLRAGRRPLPHRWAATGSDAGDAAAALRAARAGGRPARPRRVVLLFPGQGAEQPGMGARLYASEPLFRAELDRCAELLRPHLDGADLREVLGREDVREIRNALPALFAVEYALARLWMAWGVRPAAMIGLSHGEYVAACLAGVFSLPDAARLVAVRARLLGDLPEGAMLAVPLPAADVEALLPAGLELAVASAPELQVVAGPVPAVEGFAARLRELGVDGRRLSARHAYHSAMVEPVVGRLVAEVAAVARRPPDLPYVANVTGAWATEADATDPASWGAHLRRPVRFSAGLAELLRDRDVVLLECGPGDGLSRLARQQAPASAVVLPSLGARFPDEQRALLGAAGDLWAAGVDLDWDRLEPGAGRRRVPLPTYPFERRRCWAEAAPPAAAPDAGGRRPMDEWFAVPTWKLAPEAGPAPPAVESALVLRDGAGVGAAVARRLRRAGCRVVEAAPAGEDEVARLLDRFAGPPGVVYDCRTVDAPDRGRPRRAFDGPLGLARALSARGWGPSRVVVVSTRLHRLADGETADPLQALLLGPCGAAPHELQGARWSSVDVEPAAAAERWLPAALAAEAAAGDAVVALRRGRRWVRVLEPVRLPAAPAGVLRAGGVYLVTGAAGGIGGLLALHLAERWGARLALLSRAPLPAERLRRLEAAGAEVLALTAELAREDEVAAAAAAVRERFGSLDGVFHAAGAVEWRLMDELDEAGVEAVLAPKVAGTRHLVRACGRLRPGFVVLFSSLNAVIGGLGVAGYAAANAFLDAFALAHRGRPRVLAIDWAAWGGVGMGAPERRLPRAAGGRLSSLSAEEGLEALERALAGPYRQVVVSPVPVDRLPAPPPSATAPPEPGGRPRPALEVPYAPPETPDERLLAEVWRDLLGVEPVGVDDDFAQLGGDSLFALQVGVRCRRQGLAVAAADLYEARTIRRLAPRLRPATQPAAGAGTPVTGPAPVTPHQRLLFEQDLPELHFWNTSLMLELRRPVPTAALGEALRQVTRRHDALRARFSGAGARRRQRISADHAAPLDHVDLSGTSAERVPAAIEEAAARCQRGLDLERGPLLRALLLTGAAGGPDRLFLTVHHLAVDAISLAILLEDLELASLGEPLPPATASFQEWAERLQGLADADELEADLAYWRRPEWRRLPPLPLDHPGGENTRASERSVWVTLEEAATRRLLGRAAPPSAHDAVLAALLGALGEWTGADRLAAVLNRHGRDEPVGGLDVTRTVGWFATVFPALMDLEGRPDDPVAWSRRVSAQVAGVPRHGLGWGLLRYMRRDRRPAAWLRDHVRQEWSFHLHSQGSVERMAAASRLFRLDDGWRLSARARTGRRGLLLQVDGHVRGGALALRFRYSEHLHREATIAALAGRTLDHLRRTVRGLA